jgi:hypothetical protein
MLKPFGYAVSVEVREMSNRREPSRLCAPQNGVSLAPIRVVRAVTAASYAMIEL